MQTHGNLLHGEPVPIEKRDDLPLTVPQAGDRLTQDFVLFTSVAEVKGIVSVIGQKFRFSGLQLQRWSCRKDA
jgi:hypothetical protein